MCFTAHTKTTLYCRFPPLSGTEITVNDDGESPQRSRVLWLTDQNTLCETSHCRSCLLTGVGSVGSCHGRGARWTLIVMEANKDLPRPLVLVLCALLLSVPVVTLLVAQTRRGYSAGSPIQDARRNDTATTGTTLQFVLGILRFASRPWFPLVAAAATGINLFTRVCHAQKLELRRHERFH